VEILMQKFYKYLESRFNSMTEKSRILEEEAGRKDRMICDLQAQTANLKFEMGELQRVIEHQQDLEDIEDKHDKAKYAVRELASILAQTMDLVKTIV